MFYGIWKIWQTSSSYKKCFVGKSQFLRTTVRANGLMNFVKNRMQMVHVCTVAYNAIVYASHGMPLFIYTPTTRVNK